MSATGVFPEIVIVMPRAVPPGALSMLGHIGVIVDGVQVPTVGDVMVKTDTDGLVTVTLTTIVSRMDTNVE